MTPAPVAAAAIGLASIALAGVAGSADRKRPARAADAADDVKDDEFKVEYQSVYGKKRFAWDCPARDARNFMVVTERDLEPPGIVRRN